MVTRPIFSFLLICSVLAPRLDAQQQIDFDQNAAVAKPHSYFAKSNGESEIVLEDEIVDPIVENAPPVEPWVVSRKPIFDRTIVDGPLTFSGNLFGYDFEAPVTFGAYHWFHQSLIGAGGGYGIPGIRNTYFWYINSDPRLDLGDGTALGGHIETRLRETGTFRSFVTDPIWPWEAYGYYENPAGKLKAGLVYKQFGLFWDGVFFGNAPYFDGMKLDADYGVSWESVDQLTDTFKINSYMQFFLHEDQSNGSFPGADPESLVGYTERNTGVIRIVPTWTTMDAGQVEFGMSGMLGELNSTTVGLADDVGYAFGMDLTYTRGHWKLFGEGSQRRGVFHPVNYVSGGPSDELTNFLIGGHYTIGAVTYRCTYSNSIYDNPGATQNMVLAGVTVALTKNVDLYFEYVNERVDGADLPGRNGPFFNSFEYVLNWHF